MLEALAFVGITIFALTAGGFMACVVIGIWRWLLGRPLPSDTWEQV